MYDLQNIMISVISCIDSVFSFTDNSAVICAFYVKQTELHRQKHDKVGHSVSAHCIRSQHRSGIKLIVSK